MDEKLHNHILTLTKQLVDLVKDCASEDVLGMIATHCISTRREIDKKNPLASPSRQVQFLTGLLLSTSEPENPKDFTKSDWERSINILNELFSSYALMYWPSEEEYPQITDEWRESRQIAMPAFLHYFNTGILATIEQVVKRVTDYLFPFSQELSASHGISASEAINVAAWIAKYMQEHIDSFQEVHKKEKLHRIKFLNRAKEEGWDIPTMREKAQNTELPHLHRLIQQGFNGLYKVSLEALKVQFGELVATAYWSHFVISRGEVEGLTYLTEKNPVTTKPLCLISDGIAICPLVNTLYWAVLELFENYLSNYSQRDSFFRFRGKQLERGGRNILQRIFADNAIYLPSVFETQDLQNEHDLILIYKDTLIVVEAKATPPIEPFRDPSKAFIRLKRAFKSGTGIQKAFDQGSRIVDKLSNNQDINLYNDQGELIKTLQHSYFKNQLIICLTRDDFGPLAVELSLLLEKEPTQQYPWAVNILDLESIVNAYEYFGWGAEKFIQFICDRVSLQGKIIAFDELDIVGFTLEHGDLSQLQSSSYNRFHLNPTYTEIFDRIEEAQSGGEPVEYAPTQPFINDYQDLMSEVIEEASSLIKQPVRVGVKVGRNDPCPCDSGLKYKKCCGQ